MPIQYKILINATVFALMAIYMLFREAYIMDIDIFAWFGFKGL